MDTDDTENDEAVNICPMCNRAFPSLAGLRQHWSKSHTSTEIAEIIANKTLGSGSQSNTQPAPTANLNKIQVMTVNNSTTHKFGILENDGLGNCLFHSLLDFLHRNKSSFKDIPRNIDELRKVAVVHVLKALSGSNSEHSERYRNSLLVNLRNEIASWSNGNASLDLMKKSYPAYMSRPGTYGTITELCAVSEIFGFGFNIVRRNDDDGFTCYDYGSSTNMIGSRPVANLFFTGIISRGHFRLLAPSHDSSPPFIPPGNYELVESFTSSKLTSIMLCRPTTTKTSQTPPTFNPLPKVKSADVDVDFECDICGRSFDTRRGRNVHRNVHANKPDTNANSADPTIVDTTFEDFVILLTRCRSKVRVLKRVPRGARCTAANKLAQCVEDCLANPFLATSWKNLLTFAYAALRVPDKSKNISLSTLVKRNIESAKLVIPERPNKSKRVPPSLSKRVECKIAEGNVKGAVKLLSSSDTLAPQTLETFSQLQTKHPPPSRELKLPEPPTTNADVLVVSEKEVFYSIKSFPNGSGSGIDGLLPQHLKDLTLPSTGEAGLRLLKAITNLTNYMLSGKIQSRFIEIMYGASLCALEKKMGGIRPIAVGNTFRRITSKLASASVRSEMSSKFAPRQVGFGIRSGCESAAHATRTFIKKNSHRLSADSGAGNTECH